MHFTIARCYSNHSDHCISDFEDLFKRLEDAKPVTFQQYLLTESLHEAKRFKRKSLMSLLEQKFSSIVNNVCSKSATPVACCSSSNNHTNSMSSRNHSNLTPPPEV